MYCKSCAAGHNRAAANRNVDADGVTRIHQQKAISNAGIAARLGRAVVDGDEGAHSQNYSDCGQYALHAPGLTTGSEQRDARRRPYGWKQRTHDKSGEIIYRFCAWATPRCDAGFGYEGGQLAVTSRLLTLGLQSWLLAIVASSQFSVPSTSVGDGFFDGSPKGFIWQDSRVI